MCGLAEIKNHITRTEMTVRNILSGIIFPKRQGMCRQSMNQLGFSESQAADYDISMTDMTTEAGEIYQKHIHTGKEFG